MKDKAIFDSLQNFMAHIDSPVGRKKFANDKFLMDCVQFAKDAGYYEHEESREEMIPRSTALDAVFRMSNWQHGYGQNKLANTDDCVRCLDQTLDNAKKIRNRK